MDTGTECTACTACSRGAGALGVVDGVAVVGVALTAGVMTGTLAALGGGVGAEGAACGPAEAKGDVSVDVSDVANEDSDERGVG